MHVRDVSITADVSFAGMNDGDAQSLGDAIELWLHQSDLAGPGCLTVNVVYERQQADW